MTKLELELRLLLHQVSLKIAVGKDWEKDTQDLEYVSQQLNKILNENNNRTARAADGSKGS